MRSVSRRVLLAGSSALAAGVMLPMRGNAAVPPAERQMPGAYRYKVGEFELTAVTDGQNERPIEAGFVRNANVESVQDALAEAFLPTDALSICFTPLVVNTGKRLFLIDSGNGDMGTPSSGQLVENLAAAGIDTHAVDAVIISHFHGDHINGLRLKDGTLTFPNAEIMVPQQEWAFWMDDAAMSRAPEPLRRNFANTRRVFADIAKDVVRFDSDVEVAPGIVAIAAPGHTPGHTVFRIASGDEQLLFLADTTNHPALFVRNPKWQAVFDMDGDQAAATRARILDLAAADRIRVHGFHFPFPACGHIGKEGDRYRLVPTSWSSTL